jgi:hypothetical protein
MQIGPWCRAQQTCLGGTKVVYELVLGKEVELSATTRGNSLRHCGTSCQHIWWVRSWQRWVLTLSSTDRGGKVGRYVNDQPNASRVNSELLANWGKLQAEGTPGTKSGMSPFKSWSIICKVLGELLPCDMRRECNALWQWRLRNFLSHPFELFPFLWVPRIPSFLLLPCSQNLKFCLFYFSEQCGSLSLSYLSFSSPLSSSLKTNSWD